MLFAFHNPFRARRNRPNAEDLSYALITAPQGRMEVLSKFPGVVNEAAGFATPDHAELKKAMNVVHDLLNDGDNRYWKPAKDSSGKRLRLYPYQLAGVTFSLARKGRALIMDPMGLGKTLQGVAMLAAGGFLPQEALPGDTPYLPALVVCPGNAIPSWVDDFSVWAPGIEVQVASNAEEARNKLRNLIRKPAVLVMTKEQFVSVYRFYSGEVFHALFRGKIKTVILDESHYVKNENTNLARAMMAVAPVVDHVLLLTGTPMLNAAGELHSQLRIVETQSSTAPFLGTQEELLEAMAGRSVPTRSQSGFQDYVSYDDDTVQGVNSYLRRRGVRRSREDSIRSGINLYPAVADQKSMRKRRKLMIIPHGKENLIRLAGTFSDYLRALASGVSRGAQGERQAFVERAADFNNFRNQLDVAIRSKLQGKQPSKKDIQELVQQHLLPLKEILLRGHFPVNDEMKDVISDTILPSVAKHVSNRSRPVVVFTDRLSTRDRLKNVLLDQQRRKQIPPTRIYTTDGSKKVFLTTPEGQKQLLNSREGRRGKLKEGLYPLKDRFKYPKKLKKADSNAVIILTKSGLEGLNLAAAGEVVFAGRFSNPGQEYQAEDRINRPDQIKPPKATFILALDPFSLSLANRQEKKRNSILSALGETPTSDFSHPMDASQAQRVALAALPEFNRAFGESLVEPFFAEIAPEKYIKSQIAAYLQSNERQVRASQLGAEQQEQSTKAQAIQSRAQAFAGRLGTGTPMAQYVLAAEADDLIRNKSYLGRQEEVDKVLAGKKRVPFVQALFKELKGATVKESLGPMTQDPDVPGYVRLKPRGSNRNVRVGKGSVVIITTDKKAVVQNTKLITWMKGVFRRELGATNNPRARKNLPLELFDPKPTDPSEEQIRRIRTSLFQKFINEGYSKNKPIRVMGRVYGPGERLSPEDAKQLAFQMAGRRRGSRFVYQGTNKPTPLSKHRAGIKRADEEAFQKRKAYENMLAIGRKSGPYRVTVEPSYRTGKTVFYIWPLGREYRTETGARRAWEKLK